MENKIITISRQFGSGGHQIGVQLSEALGFPLFDQKAVENAAKEYGLYEQIMSGNRVNPPTNSLLYSIAANMYPLGLDTISFEQKVIMAEEETMRNLAKEGSCIFIGRAADAIFSRHPGRTSFFIHAPLEWRIKRIAKMHEISDTRAKSMIRQMDKKRANYYAERSEHRWGDAATYHMTIDSSVLGTTGSTEQILTFLRSYAQMH